ncbi:MAG: hypothetical protein C9356_10650 [Oleiphilus sp.]|nr:MAG: hypothetical protein C9356_10650 [Oleiphilus sp.]
MNTRYFVMIAGILCLAFGVAVKAEFDQHASQQQLKQLKENIRELGNWLTKANTEKSGLSRQLQKIEKDIARTTIEIRELSARSKKLTTQLQTLRKQEREQLASLNVQKDTLIKQLKAIYLQGKQPALKLLLDAEDPQNLSRYIRYFSYLKDARGEKIERFKASLDTLESTRRETLSQQAQLAKNTEQLKQRKLQLTEESGQRKNVLQKLEASIASGSEKLQKLQADQSRLEQLLLEVEEAIANIPLPQDATPFSQQKAKLPWPTRGKVQERFGSRIAQGKLRSNGIRIATKGNTKVQAVHYGRIVFSDWLRGFGLLLIIDHGDGYMSLYGNNSSLLKETGDWVSAGDLISYSGESGGASETGLYFEIRRNGKPLNPAKWLRK